MEKELAKYAVKITQVIKTTLDKTPQEVVSIILDKTPELTVEDIIAYLTGVAKRLDMNYQDVYDLVKLIQNRGNEIMDEMDWNTFWQSLAQGILWVASIIKGMLPKWAQVIISIVTAYAELKYSAAA